MDFHIVSGFLGSGKTTAIIAASKLLMSKDIRVGVVTNDQGKYLVDTAFFELADVPAVEVSGGCFCCHYDDLDARLTQLTQTARPEVIFAESVGSCADIVATVVKPLLELRADTFAPTSFSVFADARMLRRRMQNLPMPFSDDVVYIFDKQIEEAGILVINKRDLISEGDAEELLAIARSTYPDKVVRLQNSLKKADIEEWLALLTNPTTILPVNSLDMDYQRYGAGERQLAWLDETLTLHTADGMGRKAVITFLSALMQDISQQNLPVGHLKVLVKGQKENIKLSFVAMSTPEWQSDLPPLSGTDITILLNARVEGSTAILREVVRDAIIHTQGIGIAKVEESLFSSFHPDFTNPTHRFGNE